jgi:ketosteroid isomerase-like protein
MLGMLGWAPMNAAQADDFDAVVEQTRQALIAFVQGDSSGMNSLFSRGDDVVLANPLGPPLRGGSAIAEAGERIAPNFRDGTCEFEELARHATSDFGYVFHIERSESKIGENAEPSRITLRVTMIYRREDDGWKIVLRQADPIMTPQPIDSIIDKASSASDGH